MSTTNLQNLCSRADGFSIFFRQQLSDYLTTHWSEQNGNKNKNKHSNNNVDEQNFEQNGQEDFCNLLLSKIDLSQTTFPSFNLKPNYFEKLQKINEFMLKKKRFPRQVSIGETSLTFHQSCEGESLVEGWDEYLEFSNEFENFIAVVSEAKCLESVKYNDNHAGFFDDESELREHRDVFESRFCNLMELLSENSSTIKNLQIKSGIFVDDERLQNLRLQNLELSNTRDFTGKEDAFDLRNLKSFVSRSCPHLNSLNFLKDSKQLDYLELSSFGVPQTHFHKIACFSNLQHLDLYACMQFDNRSLAHIAPNLPKLEFLNISRTLCTSIDVVTPKHFPNLHTLKACLKRLMDIRPIRYLTNLSVLHLGATRQRESVELFELASLPNVTDLHIEGIGHLAHTFQCLGNLNCRKLEKVSLVNHNFDDFSSAHIPLKLKNIQSFRLSAPILSFNFLSPDARLRLRHLNLSHCTSLRAFSQITSDSLRHSLESLDVSFCQFGDSNFRSIANAGLDQLHTLKINKTRVRKISWLESFKDISCSSAFPKLEHLEMSNLPKVKDFWALTKCKNLKHLDVEGCLGFDEHWLMVLSTTFLAEQLEKFEFEGSGVKESSIFLKKFECLK